MGVLNQGFEILSASLVISHVVVVGGVDRSFLTQQITRCGIKKYIDFPFLILHAMSSYYLYLMKQ